MTTKHFLLGTAAALALTLSACGKKPDATPEQAEVSQTETAELPEIVVTDAELEGNPFRQEWTSEYGVPPFSQITDAHYLPATKKALLELREEIAAIVNNPDAPDFDNTIVALDQAGGSLNKVILTFNNITNTDTNDTLSELESEIYPMLTRETDAITFNPDLFKRVQAVYAERDRLGLD